MKWFKFFRGEKLIVHQDIILRLMDMRFTQMKEFKFFRENKSKVDQDFVHQRIIEVLLRRAESAILDENGLTINNWVPTNQTENNIRLGNERI
jgi:hypothetical protein